MNKPHDPIRGNRRAQEKWLEMISELEDMKHCSNAYV